MIPEQKRFVFTIFCITGCFMIIALKLLTLGMAHKDVARYTVPAQSVSQVASRPDIVDRNGRLLATDIKTASLFADPSSIVDLDEVVEKLAQKFPDLEASELHKKLGNRKKKFAWIKRNLTPEQQSQAHDLGLAGIGFIPEPHRVYPFGSLLSHVLGYVDVDNNGSAGVESHIDKIAGLYFPKTKANGEKPVIDISIDLGVQHILQQELEDAMKLYRAKAAAGIVLDALSGEVVSLVSLPGFNPHIRKEAVDKDRFNRVSYGTFELGSIFKVVTTAMALDYGTVSLEGGYDTTHPISIDGFTINDYHGKKRWLNVREIFTYSSNIGSAKMALDVGLKRHKSFLKRLGFLNTLKTELGPARRPTYPKHWKKISSMTIAFGHGLSVTPLQFASATAALVNGGYYIPPTFMKRSRAEGMASAKKVVKTSTSTHVRELLRLNVIKGTGKRANASGYRVGGKTGTAEKVINGRYDENRLFTSFVSVFPMDDPAYVVLVMLDEPQAAPGQTSRPTAGTNAAAVTGRFIAKVASKLGLPVLPVSCGRLR